MKTPAHAPHAELQTPSTGTQPAHRILVVDADESARSVLAVALGRDGFETMSASSSTEALRFLQPGLDLPQMLVVSSELRQEDGFSFVAQLRGDRRTSAIPVLLLARGDEAQFHQLSRVVGVDEVLLKPAYARDISTLARLQLAAAGKDGGRTLDTQTTPVAHLLRALLATSRSGVIELEKGRGHIAYRRGKVLDANFDGLHGINGLVRSMALARGAYKVTGRTLAFDAAFHFTLKELISVVLPRLQRWDELTVRSLPLDAKLGIDFGALTRALPSMPDAVNGVVRLFDGLRDVRQVLMDSPLDETVTLEIATRLYLMGVVVAVSPSQTPEVAKGDPRLFEPRPTEAVERMDALFASNQTPLQLARDDAPDEEWDRDTQGSGLEMSSDPSAGWSTSNASDVQLDRDDHQDLAAEVQQQLSAFNIQPVVEHQAPPEFAKDLIEFTTGEGAEEQPPMQQALAPLSVHALENDFFNIEETHAPARAQRTVSQAVLGFSPDDQMADGPAPVEPSRIGAVGWAVIAALLVSATAITAWKLSANNGSAAAPAPVEAIAPKIQAQPIHLTTTLVEPLEPTIEGVVAEPLPSSALADATRLYDMGKLADATRALEELVAADPSNTQAWLMLGFTRFDSGDSAGAEEAVNTVLALDPAKARAHLLRASILISAKNRPQANAEIQKYLELDPNGEFADEAKALLKR